jgi:hypothetical protein
MTAIVFPLHFTARVATIDIVALVIATSLSGVEP